MKKTFKTHEFLYYTASERGNGETDFMGENAVFTNEERFSFLHAYQKAARAWTEDDSLATKVVSDSDVSAMTALLSDPEPQVRRQLVLKDLDAYSADKPNRYRDLVLYGGAYVENNEVLLADGDIPPVACARFLIPKQNKLCVAFDLYMNPEFRGLQKAKLSAGAAGRVIELRNGTIAVAKIKLHYTGDVCISEPGVWSSFNEKIGEVRFGAYNRIVMELGDTVTVTINGTVKTDIPIKEKGIVLDHENCVDNIFFDGGMHPRGTWKIRNMTINGTPWSFEESDAPETLTFIEKANLPYVIGTYENRDKRLYLKKKFTYSPDGCETFLDVDTLDPCGKVWLNGTLVLDAKDPLRHTVCVTEYLQSGENEICLMVEPRAPETYYFWHRHEDCFNGWFCGEVRLFSRPKTGLEKLVLRTLTTEPQVRAEAEVTFSSFAKGTVKLYVTPWYPQKGEEAEVASAVVDGKKNTFTFDGDFAPWSPDTPVLYAVRAVFCDENGTPVDDLVEEFGFRTISQHNGAVMLNGKRVLMNGALIMQFLPPIELVPCNHNCPSLEQLVWQFMMIRRMNGNTARLHMLGYGSNSRLVAKAADYLGVMLIWVTRLVDSLESMVFSTEWQEAPYYQQQMRDVINHPSIVVWEGSNEFFPQLHTLDRMYEVFVGAARAVDNTRLLCPCSHFYYAWEMFGYSAEHYTDDGKFDHLGNPVQASPAWNDPLVIRSAHTYCMLGGYDALWEEIRKQRWPEQKNLLESKRHSYHVSEFAITALPNPTTAEAQKTPYPESYERFSEAINIGHTFAPDEWRESQAYQGFTAFNAIKKMRLLDVDGMTWCCLSGGANHGAYMKPPIDFYGYAKLGFYGIREGYQELLACNGNLDMVFGTDDLFYPTVVHNGKEGAVNLEITFVNEQGDVVDQKTYNNVLLDKADAFTALPPFKPAFPDAGHYTVILSVHTDVK